VPDPSLPISNQLEQAMDIIRNHIKLLAEAKIQSDLSRKRIEEAESKARKLENDLNIRDKAITELRLRLPCTIDRDILIENSMKSKSVYNEETGIPVKAAQSTIESLQVKLIIFMY
jgi:hypothetical protein